MHADLHPPLAPPKNGPTQEWFIAVARVSDRSQDPLPVATLWAVARPRRQVKGRVHIFWQRRIRAGDMMTPYWFPSQTSSGSIREDRLVFPIPPGTHWRDGKPIILPGRIEISDQKSEVRKQRRPTAV